MCLVHINILLRRRFECRSRDRRRGGVARIASRRERVTESPTVHQEEYECALCTFIFFFVGGSNAAAATGGEAGSRGSPAGENARLNLLRSTKKNMNVPCAHSYSSS